MTYPIEHLWGILDKNKNVLILFRKSLVYPNIESVLKPVPLNPITNPIPA